MTHSFVPARVSPSCQVRERLDCPVIDTDIHTNDYAPALEDYVYQSTEVLAESWQLVEEGVITEADFKAWTFDHPYRLYTDAKADFFEGTAIKSKVKPEAAVAAE